MGAYSQESSPERKARVLFVVDQSGGMVRSLCGLGQPKCEAAAAWPVAKRPKFP
jgi:hypothetical protein